MLRSEIICSRHVVCACMKPFTHCMVTNQSLSKYLTLKLPKQEMKIKKLSNPISSRSQSWQHAEIGDHLHKCFVQQMHSYLDALAACRQPLTKWCVMHRLVMTTCCEDPYTSFVTRYYAETLHLL